jgi:nucleotidyltransferase/DNA polymerase involved in DNA repair
LYIYLGTVKTKYHIFAIHVNLEVVCAHVATLGPGDTKPDYYPSPSRHTHKVSLDPYRKASAKIFTVFQRLCPNYQKGGLDEVFMDVTDIVNQKLMEQFGNDLSKWDPDSKERIHWKRDYPELGVVLGLTDQDSRSDSADQNHFDQDDSSDDDDEEEDDENAEIEQGIGGVESENELPEDFGNNIKEFLGYDFDDSFSASDNTFQNEKLEPTTPTSTTPQTKNDSNVTNQINKDDEKPKESSGNPNQDESNEEERLLLEMEELRPYYGIPEESFEEEFWAEMQLLKAAEFCRQVRYTVKDELGYTCSAGIGNNRLIAKLGSGMNKPFNQVNYPKLLLN